MHAANNAEQQFLFRSEQSWFSLPALAVREVSVAPDMIRVPDCQRSLAGLCRQRSEFIPVISLAAILDMETADDGAENWQMITLAGVHPWALRIAQAAGLVLLDAVATTDSRGDDRGHSPVVGTAVHEDEVVRVLDPARLYAVVSQALEDDWQRQSRYSHPALTATGSQS